MKRMICTALAALLICLSITCLSVGATSENDFGFEGSLECDAVYLEELNTGTVVYEYYANESYHSRIYPASTTKVMTYIVVAENVTDLDGTKIEITEQYLAGLDPESSVMGLEYHIGQSFSVRDLLYGLMLPSGNDAALVLAEYVGGSVDGFVDMMNRKAAQIGCRNTHFTSPHGLHDPEHYTTLLDLAAITKYAMKMKNSSFMEICNTVSYQPEGFFEPIKNTNFLLDSTAEDGVYYYSYAKGIKTGYTDEAGKCLISTAEKDGYTYLCLAMGADYSFADNVNYAMLDTVKLYNWAFDNIAMIPVYAANEVVRSVPVKYVWGSETLDVISEHEVSTLLPKDYDPEKVTLRIECADEAVAPVTQGQALGKVTVSYEDEVIGTTDIVASKSVERNFFKYILTEYFVWIIVVIVVLVIVLILLIRAHSRKKARLARRAGRRVRP